MTFIDQSNYSRSTISRPSFIQMLDIALESRSNRFARQAAEQWLSIYPGDLEVKLLHALGYLGDGQPAHALTILEQLIAIDPEYVDAQDLYAFASKRVNPSKSLEATGCAYALGKSTVEAANSPEWSILFAAHRALENKTFEDAEGLILQVLGSDLETPLPAVVHIRIAGNRQDLESVHKLAKIYHTRWPDCLQFSLILAHHEMEMGNGSGAVELLHACVAQDTAGQVAERLWGKNHRYRPLWPDKLEISFDLPVPAEVAGPLGWNILSAGDKRVSTNAAAAEPPARMDTSAKSVAGEAQPARSGSDEGAVPFSGDSLASEIGSDSPDSQEEPPQSERRVNESLRSVEEAFGRLAVKLNRPSIAKSDGRFPMYIILSMRLGLVNQYGAQTAGVIEKEMRHLADVIRSEPGWGAMVFYPDDLEYASQLGLEVIQNIDPWKIKLALVDLDQMLAKRGEMIGALLIVGGPEVVPFHMLPNPTDDMDKEIPSDNPYGTLDSNYFITEWPVGRLPGEAGPDAGLILAQLRRLIREHNHVKPATSWKDRLSFPVQWWKRLVEWVQSVVSKEKSNGLRVSPSFGISASVWKQASKSAFRPIGEKQELLISPPEISGSFPATKLTWTSLGYYNLHGLPDTAEWYGQRDVADPMPGPDYPVAVNLSDLSKNGQSPQVVFTEACYGGHILNKTESQALALKFLSIGTPVVVGSTCVSYGSVGSPLIGADLLAYSFWTHLQEGHTAGEALMLAKVDLVKEMSKRQGFLDGEDQKTLISFVLYGDPLWGRQVFQARTKDVPRMKSISAIKTICDRREGDDLDMQRLPSEVLMEVKQAVEAYLPGLDDAEILVSEQHVPCSGKGHSCPTAELNAKTAVEAEPTGKMVVTISKQIEVAHKVHRHYARVTVDAKGKMVKLAVSR